MTKGQHKSYGRPTIQPQVNYETLATFVTKSVLKLGFIMFWDLYGHPCSDIAFSQLHSQHIHLVLLVPFSFFFFYTEAIRCKHRLEQPDVGLQLNINTKPFLLATNSPFCRSQWTAFICTSNFSAHKKTRAKKTGLWLQMLGRLLAINYNTYYVTVRG